MVSWRRWKRGGLRVDNPLSVREELVPRMILDDLIGWLNSLFDRIRGMFG